MRKTFTLFLLPFLTAIILSGTVSACLSASTSTDRYYTDINGNTITNANIGDNIYGVVNVVNYDSVSTSGLVERGVTNPALTYMNSYSTSQDNGNTWNDNDGSFDFVNNAWEYGDMQLGDSYLLRELFQVNGPEPIDLTITDGEMPLQFSANVESTLISPLKIDSYNTKTGKIHTSTKRAPAKLTALTSANLNPTYYAALLRMNK